MAEHAYKAITDMIDNELEDTTTQSLFSREVSKLTNKEITKLSFNLGLTSFGGPLDHQELIKQIMIKDNRYLKEGDYNSLLELCLLLPGYSSSNFLAALCIINTKHISSGILAMLCYNLPSIIVIFILSPLMNIIKYEIRPQMFNSDPNAKYFSLIHDTFLFSLMALGAGIAQAALSLLLCSSMSISKKLSNSAFQVCLLLISGGIYFYNGDYFILLATMVVCGIASIIKGDHDYIFELNPSIKKYDNIKFTGGICLALFFAILFSLIGINKQFVNQYTLIGESFLRFGLISIGEGHAVIPLILSEYKTKLEEAEVLNGYAFVRILPSSLLNISAYIGVISLNILGGVISWVCILIPGFLFMLSALPHVAQIKSNINFQFFIRGANSCAIGFILAASAKLWIDSCYVNPYTNIISGTINVIGCCLLSELCGLHKTMILLLGSLFNLLSEITLFFIGIKAF